MKTVDKFEFPASASHGSKHDWNAILAAKVTPENLGKPGIAVVLEDGVDFTGNPENFANTCRIKAMERHLLCKAVVTSIEVKGKNGKEDKIKTLIYVQVADMNDEQVAEADVKIASRKERDKASMAKRTAAKKVAGAGDGAGFSSDH